MVLRYLHKIWRNDRLSNWREKSINLAEPSNGKVAPLFQPHHVITSILLIGRNQPLGRYELCDNLTIGEGSVRTLLKHLTTNGYIAPEKILEYLYKRNIMSLLIEGGGITIGNFLFKKLIDRVIFIYGAILIGGKDAPTVSDAGGVESLSDSIRLHNIKRFNIGNDFVMQGDVCSPE